MENFNKLIFSVARWPENVKHIIIDFDKGCVEVKDCSASLRFCSGAEEFARFSEAVAACEPENWSSMDSPVLEGTIWNLTLCRSGVPVKNCNGINRFPNHWDEFMKLVRPFFRKLDSCPVAF